ncbi:13349_t:CDS:2, partial [Funneliformis geosporum]
MSTTDNSDIISLNLRFRNSQNRNVIFVIEVSKNDLVSVIADRVRGILAPHLPVRPHNFHLQQIYPTSIQRRLDQQKFSFTDFKFKGILGEGRSGKTLLCEFRGDMIALKSVDLSKAPSYVLEEMQKEVEIYKDLADIQGKYIPKLVCYGYYGG